MNFKNTLNINAHGLVCLFVCLLLFYIFLLARPQVEVDVSDLLCSFLRGILET